MPVLLAAIPLAPAAAEAVVALGYTLLTAAGLLAAKTAGESLGNAIANAQDDANDNTSASSSTVTATVSSTTECKDCIPDPNCDKWLMSAKKALYESNKPAELGGVKDSGKGLYQRLCEWIHGSEPNGGNHSQSVIDTNNRLRNAMGKLNDRRFRCEIPDELQRDAREVGEAIGDSGENLAKLPHDPKPDFKQLCYDRAVQLATKHLGMP